MKPLILKPQPFLVLLLSGLLLIVTPGIHAQQPLPPERPIGGAPIVAEQSPSAPPTSVNPAGEKTTSIQFPHTSVNEVLNYYEQLTGKRIIRDSNLTGPELTIFAANEIPLTEAVAMIESSLLLNGYTLIPVDEKTVKILGPSRPVRTEGLPLYLEESQLPQNGDKLVSFYKPLRFLSPDEASRIIQGIIQVSPLYTSLVSVPNTSSLIITEKTPVIRKILAILEVIDREPSKIITEFIPLQRANAEKVVETLNSMFGTGAGTTARPSGQPQGNAGGSVTTGGDIQLLSGKPQFIADKRTNRVLIIVKAENYKYLRELISKLDQPADASLPLVRPLNYLPVNDVFPVLVDMLKGKDDTESGKSGQASATPAPTPPPSQNSSSAGGGSLGSSAGTGGAVAVSVDKLSDPQQSTPQSITIGPATIISDPNANSIIVYGPSDTQKKAKEIIDLLDQRPKQVYLAAVIGQLQLTEGIDYGASWFAKLNNGGSNNLVGAALNNTFAGALTNLVTSGLTNAINAFPSSLTGLTVYGTVAQGISTYAHFLESTGKFRTLARPVVYTSNNKKATIFSGQNVPVPTTTQVNTTPGISGSSVNSTVGYQPVVLKLEVIPLINSDHEVNLQIAQHNDKLGDYVNIGGNSVPNILTQELTTSVRVPSGSTIVLGGLITDDKTIDDSGIPYLGKIPIIGPLLGGQSKKTRTRSELIVMIQPVVVDSNDAMEKASIGEGSESELGRRAKDIKNKLDPSPTPKPRKKGFHLFQLPKIDNY